MINKKFLLKKRNIFFVCLLILSYFFLKPSPKAKIYSSAVIRGVWLTNVFTAFLHHTTLLDNLFYHLAKSGYTHVYISTYGYGGTLYQSNHSSSNSLFVPPFTNVLKASENEAQRQGLKLYAWLEFGLMLMKNDAIALQHPDWLLKTKSGETVIDGFVWLNPEHPEVQRYILGIIEEVAHYEGLAGIQLDDHWSVPRQFGNYIIAMNELTAKARQRIKEINPELILSVSPNPHSFSKEKYNQDWLHWANNGYIDEVVIQIYRDSSAEFVNSILTSKVDRLPRNVPVAIGIFAGPLDKPKDFGEVNKQIKLATDLGYGFSIFCWEYRALGGL